MTLTDFERRLQAANPKLTMKRAGWGVMGIYHRGKFVCRTSDREITPYTVTKRMVTEDPNLSTLLNPYGFYEWRMMQHRGRREIAELLYDRKLIKHTDIASISK